MPVIVTNVDIRIDDIGFPIDVALTLEEEVPHLLGKTDVFDRFWIVFDQSEGSIILSEGSIILSEGSIILSEGSIVF